MKYILIIAALYVAAASIASAQAKLEIVGGDTHDWGKVKAKDSPLKTVVKIKNVGNELLKITDVHPGCGCTKTAELDKKELKPGEIASTEISLNLGSSSGQITKSVAITSNDPANPSKTLILKADIVRDINLLPTSYFTFKDMEVGKTATASLFMQNNSTEDITITNTSAINGAMLNLKKGTILKKGAKLEIIASITPKEKGYYQSSCRIETSHKDYQEMEIPAYGTVRGIGESAATPPPTSPQVPQLADGSAAPIPAIAQANPTQDLAVSPSSILQFTNLKIGKKSQAQITLQNTSKKDVVIKFISTSNGLTLNLTKGMVIKPGAKQVVVGSITPTAKGNLNAIAQIMAENGAANLLLVAAGEVK
jgi:hypothetical protein